MGCWICVHGLPTDAPPVGVCLVCHICACDEHGDRPTHDRFWCFICLQRIALNTAGLPAQAPPAPLSPDLLTASQVYDLWSRLSQDRDQLADVIARARRGATSLEQLDTDTDQLGQRALDVAVVLAVRSAGAEWIDHVRLLEGERPIAVDRRLAILFREL